MKKIHLQILSIIILSSALVLSGCVSVKSRGHGHQGPPPHAPAHGYRQKHHGHQLEYDSHLGVYLVIGMPSIYFVNGIYYKVTDHGWLSSSHIDGGWVDYDHRKLPSGLHKKYKGKKYKAKKHKRKNEYGHRGRDDDREKHGKYKRERHDDYDD